MMATVPRSLCDSSLLFFHLAISSPDPWPSSLSLSRVSLTLFLTFESSFVALFCFREKLQMKSGDKHGLGLGFHLPNLSRDHGGSRKYQQSDVTPKGCMVVRVGEERQRFVVPVVYLNHPLFAGLLKEAEEEYGFEQEGAITIPCRVDYFRQVRGMIDRESLMMQQHHNHLFHLHPLHLRLSGCFKA